MQNDTPRLPLMTVHSAPKCVPGRSAKVGAHVLELAHGENLTVGMPVHVAICGCCGPLSDSEIRQLVDAGLEALAPAHSLRQMEVAAGAQIVTEKEACAHLKIGHTKFWDLVKNETFPQPMKRGKNNVWLLNELLQRYARRELKEA